MGSGGAEGGTDGMKRAAQCLPVSISLMSALVSKLMVDDSSYSAQAPSSGGSVLGRSESGHCRLTVGDGVVAPRRERGESSAAQARKLLGQLRFVPVRPDS